LATSVQSDLKVTCIRPAPVGLSYRFESPALNFGLSGPAAANIACHSGRRERKFEYEKRGKNEALKKEMQRLEVKGKTGVHS